MKSFNSNALPTTLRSLSGETPSSQKQIASGMIHSEIAFHNLGASSRASDKEYQSPWTDLTSNFPKAKTQTSSNRSEHSTSKGSSSYKRKKDGEQDAQKECLSVHNNKKLAFPTSTDKTPAFSQAYVSSGPKHRQLKNPTCASSPGKLPTDKVDPSNEETPGTNSGHGSIQATTKAYGLTYPLFPSNSHALFASYGQPNVDIILQTPWPPTPEVAEHLGSKFVGSHEFILKMDKQKLKGHYLDWSACDWATSRLSNLPRNAFEDVYAVLILCYVGWGAGGINSYIAINLSNEWYCRPAFEVLGVVKQTMDYLLSLTVAESAGPTLLQNLYCLRRWLSICLDTVVLLPLPKPSHHSHMYTWMKFLTLWGEYRVWSPAGEHDMRAGQEMCAGDFLLDPKYEAED